MKNIEDVDVYVRFCETDAAGHVSNTSYFLYMEEACAKFFEKCDFETRENKKLNVIIARTECDFIAQAYAGQTLTVATVISKIGTKSYTLSHVIKEVETGLVIAKGSAVVVCFDFLEQKSMEIPTKFRSILESNLVTI
jgi:acyl-CoA thioester hydrolase